MSDMRRRVISGLVIQLIFVFFVSPSHSRAGAVADYYLAMVDEGESRFPYIESENKRNSMDTFLVVGDILSFVGKPSTLRFPVDALIISTNVQLRFDTDNPRVQKKFRDILPKTQRQLIEESFRKKGRLSAVKEELLVDLGNFSPRFVCFLATDKYDGGTFEDPKWQVLLDVDNIKIGVERCLNRLQKAGATTIVTPLIGSSANPLVEKETYIKDKFLREEHIERRVRSLEGIIAGAESSKPAPREFGIVVWGQDVRKVINPKYLEDKRYREMTDENTGFCFSASSTSVTDTSLSLPRISNLCTRFRNSRILPGQV